MILIEEYGKIVLLQHKAIQFGYLAYSHSEANYYKMAKDIYLLIATNKDIMNLIDLSIDSAFCAIFILILFTGYAFSFYYSQKPWNRWPIYIILIPFSFIFPILLIASKKSFDQIPTSADSARYFLSNLVQSEVTIFALVITFSLIAAQIAASSYSLRILDVFKHAKDHKLIAIIFFINIIYSLGLIKLLQDENPIQMEYFLLISFQLGCYSFLALMAYLWNIFDLLKPINAIDWFSQKLKFDYLAKAIDPGGENDTIQPIKDIILSSISKFDEETMRFGINKLTVNICNCLENESIKMFNEDKLKNISKVVFYHYNSIGNLASKLNEGHAIEHIVKGIGDIGTISAKIGQEDFASRAAKSFSITALVSSKIVPISAETEKLIVDYLKDMCLKLILKNKFQASIQAVVSLGSIGSIYAVMGFMDINNKIIDSLSVIGSEAFKTKNVEAEDIIIQIVAAFELIFESMLEAKEPSRNFDLIRVRLSELNNSSRLLNWDVAESRCEEAINRFSSRIK